MAAGNDSATPLIKGYLPVRLKLPPFSTGESDETFLYIKEHQGPHKKRPKIDSTKEAPLDQTSSSATLFVCNAPIVPPIRTRLLLKLIFGRYGSVRKVTVVESPRLLPSKTVASPKNTVFPGMVWTGKFPASPSFLAPPCSEGKYAHVEFDSSKEMKRVYRTLAKIMSRSGTGDNDLPGISLSQAEKQALSEESDRLQREECTEMLENDDENNDAKMLQKKTGDSLVLRLAQRYRASCQHLIDSRAALLEECNAVMTEYEGAEAQARLTHETAASQQPDPDGFVTVSYSGSYKHTSELEQTNNSKSEENGRRNGSKRNRRKKQGLGATELPDFYRFQAKANRKRNVDELRERFEKDLAKVKRLKEEGQYRPF